MSDNPYFPRYRFRSLLPDPLLRRIDPFAAEVKVQRELDLVRTKNGAGYGRSSAVDLARRSGFEWLAAEYQYPNGMSATEFDMRVTANKLLMDCGPPNDPRRLAEINVVNDQLVQINLEANPDLASVRRQRDSLEKEWAFCNGVRFRYNADDIDYYITTDPMHSSDGIRNLTRQGQILNYLFGYPEVGTKPMVYHGAIMSPQTMDRLEEEIIGLNIIDHQLTPRGRPANADPSPR